MARAELLVMLVQAKLKELLEYDPETGIFRWRLSRTNIIKAGQIAGCRTGDGGYWRISINRRSYGAHRLAWFYSYGKWPKLLDHINRNPLDNRISNLREATQQQNCANRRLQKNNSTGYRGVSYSKRHNKFLAQIQTKRKTSNLGYFNTAEEAAKIAAAERVKRYGVFAT